MRLEIEQFVKKQPERVGREISYLLEHNVRSNVTLFEVLEAIYDDFKNDYRKMANGDFPDTDPRSDNYRPFGMYG
jgi:hypothetical protein